ncbi:alanine racemase [Candidatus Marinamargulisbacteria bacterium SCGC AAA071-K20]|nr:alanine racemase [Candidatus Marinamargulisbacteria bacterium SCGC AAA071-K20]
MPRASRLINLEIYKRNLKNIRKTLGNNVQLMAVVKANAYGHGGVAIAKAAIQAGVNCLGVAAWQEAKELREAGLNHPIQLLSENDPKSILDNVTITIYSEDQINLIMEKAKNENKVAKVILKVDTGMHRLGILPKGVPQVLSSLNNSPHLELEGIMTHLSTASSKTISESQLNVFTEIIDSLKTMGIDVPFIHMASSDITEKYPNMHFDMVRIGLASYQNVMTIKTQVISIKSLKAGAVVGYDNHYVLKKNAKIGVIKIGYADGVPMISNQGAQVSISDVNYPIIGKVSMDMMFIELREDNSAVKVGDEVTLSPTKMSKDLNLNHRELTCSFDRPRCKLVYKDVCLETK